MSHNALLDIRDLSVDYRTLTGSVSALRNVSLRLEKHRSLGIIGESGSGKSTLAYTIMNYLAGNGEASGRIFFQGEDLLEKDERSMEGIRGDKIAMVYQNPYSSLNPSLTIGRQLDEVSIFHRKMSRKKARAKSIAVLKDLYLGDAEGIVKRYPHQLSGGMQQRICIAMALLCRPDLLILDEPTTALDVTTEVVILDLINDLKKRYNMSLIYISHDMGVVNKVCDSLAVMYRGELVEFGEKSSLFSRPEHPYTRALINCIPRRGIVKEEFRLNTVPGYVKKRGSDEGGCPFAERCAKKTPGCEEAYGLCERGPGHLSACDRAYASDKGDDSLVPSRVMPEAEGRESEVILRASELTRIYRNRGRKLRAVNGISFDLEKGKVLGIVGESGCGKSSMGNVVTGLLKPSGGRLDFKGHNIGMSWRHRSPEILKEIQLIFQNPGRSLNPSFTIEQILGRPMKRLMGISSREERRRRIVEILKKVDLGKEYLKRKPTQLSGGEMQRIAIARAFVLSPDLLICDEPTSALDVSVQSSVLNLLTDLQSQSGASYMFISHDLNVINYISDSIMVMYLGQVMEYGRKEAVMSAPFHPYTEALLSAVPDVDPSVEKEVIRLEGAPPDPTEKLRGCPFQGRCPRKIGEICEIEAPVPHDLGEGHRIACHLFA